MDGKMDFAGFNAGFAEFFNNAENPTTTTRTTMQVTALAGPQFLVELTVIAAK
jgi:enamine deaminase RidA (YjgF/YER057c/UK114 family)